MLARTIRNRFANRCTQADVKDIAGRANRSAEASASSAEPLTAKPSVGLGPARSVLCRVCGTENRLASVTVNE